MKENVDTTTRLADTAPDAAECRRLALDLNLDAVGIVRRDGGRRRVSWWAAPDVGVRPSEVAQILEGRASGWISCPRGEDVVFAHLTPGSSVRSVATLSALLGERPDETEGPTPQDLGGVAPGDPVARERTRLAYAIHDGLTQVVTAAVLELEWLARRAELEPREMSEALTSTATEMRKALEEIRGCSRAHRRRASRRPAPGRARPRRHGALAAPRHLVGRRRPPGGAAPGPRGGFVGDP
jgi:hypothetical protein